MSVEIILLCVLFVFKIVKIKTSGNFYASILVFESLKRNLKQSLKSSYLYLLFFLYSHYILKKNQCHLLFINA
jgi:hypothetical protein